MCTALCMPRLVCAPPSMCMILPPPFHPTHPIPPLPPPYLLDPPLPSRPPPPTSPPYPLPPTPPPYTPPYLQGRGGGGDFVRYMPPVHLIGPQCVHLYVHGCGCNEWDEFVL